MKLPPGHLNGHLPDATGHALSGFNTMSYAELDRLLRPLVAAGVQFLAIEWDFPRFEKFPDDLGLKFFTIMRDPVQRLLSNFTYDVVGDFTPASTIREYLERPDIWTRGNYYTRFFSGVPARQPVGEAHVDYAFGVLSRHFRLAFFGADLQNFLVQQVGLPIRTLPRENRTGGLGRFLKRARLQVSPADLAYLRDINALDYSLCDRLRSL